MRQGKAAAGSLHGAAASTSTGMHACVSDVAVAACHDASLRDSLWAVTQCEATMTPQLPAGCDVSSVPLWAQPVLQMHGRPSSDHYCMHWMSPGKDTGAVAHTTCHSDVHARHGTLTVYTHVLDAFDQIDDIYATDTCGTGSALSSGPEEAGNKAWLGSRGPVKNLMTVTGASQKAIQNRVTSHSGKVKDKSGQNAQTSRLH